MIAASIRQPATGQVDLSYFADAAFLGDSLTVGFTDYDINLGGALICGYIGAGPDTIVNRMTVNHMTRGDEIALDVLAAAQPKKLYILLGTNTLTTAGAEDRFLTYYGAMLDTLRETLGPDCVIYVQSIPPVRPEAAAERPGLTSGNLRNVNEQLAKLADSKGCVYLDLWEALADGEGNLKAVLRRAGRGPPVGWQRLRRMGQLPAQPHPVCRRQPLDGGQRLCTVRCTGSNREVPKRGLPA